MIASSAAVTRCWPWSPWYQAITSTIGSPISSASVTIGCSAPGRWKVSVTYARPCSRPQAPAAYAMPHCTTLRRRRRAQRLSISECPSRLPSPRRSPAVPATPGDKIAQRFLRLVRCTSAVRSRAAPTGCRARDRYWEGSPRQRPDALLVSSAPPTGRLNRVTHMANNRSLQSLSFLQRCSAVR